jgi:hypothetical protein
MSRWQEEARWYRQRAQFAEAEAAEYRQALPAARRDRRIRRSSIREGTAHMRDAEAAARWNLEQARKCRPWWWFW